MDRPSFALVGLVLSSLVAGCSAEVGPEDQASEGANAEEAVASTSLELTVCTARPEWNGACPAGTEVRPSAAKTYAIGGKTAYFSVRAAGGQNGKYWPAISPRVFQGQPAKSWYELTSGVSLESVTVSAPASAPSFTFAPLATDRTEAKRNAFWPNIYAFAQVRKGAYTLRANAVRVGACNMVLRSGAFELLDGTNLERAALPTNAPKASCPTAESASFVVNVVD